MSRGRIGRKRTGLLSLLVTAGALLLTFGASAEDVHARPGRKTPRMKQLPRVTSPLADDQAVLAEVNRIRKARGLRPFRFDMQLWIAARDHSLEQARFGYMGHGSPVRGRDRLEQRIDLAGYDGRAFGEVVAYGYRSARDVVQGWMDSRGHREILMDREFTEAAFSRIGTYWTGNVGIPRVRRAQRTPRSAPVRPRATPRPAPGTSSQRSRAGTVPPAPSYTSTPRVTPRYTAPVPRRIAPSKVSSPRSVHQDAGAGTVPTFRRVSTANWFSNARSARQPAPRAPSTRISAPANTTRRDRGAASVDALWPSNPQGFRYEPNTRVRPAARPTTPYRAPVRPAVRPPSRPLTPATVRPVRPGVTAPRVAPKPIAPLTPAPAPRATAVPPQAKPVPQKPRRVRAKRVQDDCFT